MEYNPRLNLDNLIIENHKIILGSFPIWSLSDLGPCSEELLADQLLTREENRDSHFFFGSSKSAFWTWYKLFVDPQLDIGNIPAILVSINDNNIGITDVIQSCQRKNRSSLDKHLTHRTYNHKFFNYPPVGVTLKILCTSKGVLNDMLLNPSFYKSHKNLSDESNAGDNFQLQFLKSIGGGNSQLKTPIFRTLKVLRGGRIECLAIPSPGSPFRKLTDFGLITSDLRGYLTSYLKNAFKWFLD